MLNLILGKLNLILEILNLNLVQIMNPPKGSISTSTQSDQVLTGFYATLLQTRKPVSLAPVSLLLNPGKQGNSSTHDPKIWLLFDR